jgi:small subunit ribosomal protein S8
MPYSKSKVAISKVLLDEGFIAGYSSTDDAKPQLTIELKYYQSEPVIESIDRVSRPGLRIYKGKDEFPNVKNGLGVSIVSTSRGVMTGKSASKLGCGGEVLCLVT